MTVVWQVRNSIWSMLTPGKYWRLYDTRQTRNVNSNFTIHDLMASATRKCEMYVYRESRVKFTSSMHFTTRIVRFNK